MGRTLPPSSVHSSAVRTCKAHPSLRWIAFVLILSASVGDRLPAIAQSGVQASTLADLSAPLLEPPARDTVVAGADATAMRLAGINSPERDDTPIITADSRLMFFNSTRHGDRSWARTIMGRYDDDIYVATARTDGRDEWTEPVNLRSVNTSDDDGIVAISSSGHLVYYLSLRRGWQTNGGPFYQAERRGIEVAAMRGLGGGITRFFAGVPVKGNIRIFGASMSADGRSFYFATTAYSRTADHEIWVATRPSAEGEWGAPRNLGPLVNAGGGSYAPFIAADGRTLYFASGRPGGLGGDDIYMTVNIDGVWRQPINVGAPINSPDDDAFLSLPAAGDRVYFSSTRSGNGDLFVAPMRPELRPSNVALLTTLVRDSLGGEPLEATVTIEDAATGAVVFRALTSATDGHAATILRPGGRYTITVAAPEYVYQSETLVIPQDSTFAEFSRTYRLRRPVPMEAVRLENIVFDHRSATLRPESYPELERLAAFLTEAPALRIAVHGHTDSTGTDGFNRQLSHERAASVREYLISAGSIDASRIEIQGFGASRPLVPNTDERREINRRVEFVILSPKTETAP
jgi:OOP family OmpA-OmpF porin